MCHKPKFKRLELKSVNLKVTVSANEVRVWACSQTTGINVFRLKATGYVVAPKDSIKDIIILGRHE